MPRNKLFNEAQEMLSSKKFTRWLCYTYGVMCSKMDEADLKLIKKELKCLGKEE